MKPAGQWRTERLLRRAALWIGLTTMLFCLVIGSWFYLQSGRVIDESINNQAIMLVSGLANAVEQDLITRDYSTLEVKLRQSLANPNVESALVADTLGIVLSHVQRDPASSAVNSVFQPPSVVVPTSDLLIQRTEQEISIWRSVPRQHPIGWVRLQLSPDTHAGTIETLRWQMIVLVSIGTIGMMVVLGLILMNVQAQIAHEASGLEFAATHDSLTGLPNRLLLMSRLDDAIAQCRSSKLSLAVCFLDVDNFKDVNDSFGHDAGDRVLVEVARRLRNVLRQSDTVARIAGDEFVILINSIRTKGDYRELLGRIMSSMSPPIPVQGDAFINITLSIGVTVHPEDTGDAQTLLIHADKALYEAKSAGKNTWRIYDVKVD